MTLNEGWNAQAADFATLGESMVSLSETRA